MRQEVDLLRIVQTSLGTFDNRQPFSPGMFEPLKPLFRSLGYDSAAVYISDDYPDRMHLEAGYGGKDFFPSHVALNKTGSLHKEMLAAMAGVPNALVAGLYSHGRELGALCVTTPDARKKKTRDEFKVLARSLSIMAYVERLRTNEWRERQEREIFFAQSLTNRLLIREAPKVKGLRIGFEFARSLEAGGDFFDLVPTADGNLFGFIGCCNGKGLKTVLEVTNIMREIYRACRMGESLAGVATRVNNFLVKEKRRAHQASLALFNVDVGKRKATIAKAGRIGMLLCGPGAVTDNLSAAGGIFLGMTPTLKVKEETFDFRPGQGLFCVTEGFYNARNCLNVAPQLHWFMRTVETTLRDRRKIPLAKAIFNNLDTMSDPGARPVDSMLALSVEHVDRQRRRDPSDRADRIPPPRRYPLVSNSSIRHNG